MSEDKGAKPWYEGLDAEHIGHLQNKGWDKLDPVAAALAATKSHREAERVLRAPASEVLRMPKEDDPAATRAFWERLGAPAQMEGYKDLKLEGPLGDAARKAAYDLHMPAGMTTAFVERIATQMAADKAAEETRVAAQIQLGRGKLETEWAAQKDMNRFVAQRAVDALGLAPEMLQALERVDYHKAWSTLHSLGVKMGEGRFIEGGSQGGIAGMTKEQAVAQRSAWMADTNWVKRWMGGMKTQEWQDMAVLDEIIRRS